MSQHGDPPHREPESPNVEFGFRGSFPAPLNQPISSTQHHPGPGLAGASGARPLQWGGANGAPRVPKKMRLFAGRPFRPAKGYQPKKHTQQPQKKKKKKHRQETLTKAEGKIHHHKGEIKRDPC